MRKGIVTIVYLTKKRRGTYKAVDEFYANFTTTKNKKLKQLVYCYRLKDAVMPKKEIAFYHKKNPKKIVLVEDLPEFLKAGIQQQIEQQHPELIREISG